MGHFLVILLTFSAGVLVVGGIYSLLCDLILRDRTRINERLDAEFHKKQRERAGNSPLFKDLGRMAGELNRLETPNLHARYLAMVEQSGLDLTPRHLSLIQAGVGLCLAAPVLLLTYSAILTLLALALGAALPLIYVLVKRNLRLEKLRSQLPDAFDMMGRAIRAGQTMSQSLLEVASEFPAPIAAEFAYCYHQQNLGLSPELALRDLARRSGLMELKIFVVAVLVQRQTGGNLAELLDKLAHLVRDRYRIRGTIKTLTAEGRMQAAVLLALPVALFLLLFLLNRSYAQALLDHPELPIGVLCSEMIGALWIRKIVNFDF